MPADLAVMKGARGPGRALQICPSVPGLPGPANPEIFRL